MPNRSRRCCFPTRRRRRPTTSARPVAPVDTSNVIQLSARARRWRNVATATTAIAAALVAMVATQLYAPDRLPDGLRPKVRTQVVEVKTTVTPPLSGQFVALLQKDSASPAFILTVDGASKNFTVRRVGATPEAGKSFELWVVSDRLQRPRSLGVIGGNDFTTRSALASYDADTVNKATYAVTVEPEGGSPTGAPTGPVVFTGKLIEAVPPPAPGTPATAGALSRQRRIKGRIEIINHQRRLAWVYQAP